MSLDYPRPRSLEHLETLLASFTDYEKMEAFHTGKVRCDLETMERLDAALGRPHRGIPCVHVTGSKGKGSTVLMAAALLEAAGLKCGVFTSPHLVHLKERIAVGGSPAVDDLLLDASDRVFDVLRRDRGLSPTFFEFMTAAAMVAFSRAAVDVAVYEVGLGGRLDATNVVEPEVSVITHVEMEHTPRLGTTVAAIAREKAGIIKPGVPVAAFLHRGDPARAVVAERAASLGAPLIAPEAGIELFREGGRYAAKILDRPVVTFLPPPPAPVQARNAALALCVFHVLGGAGERRGSRGAGKARPATYGERVRRVSRLCAGEGPRAAVLERVRLPGRFETLRRPGGRPLTILDCAHSPASVAAVAREARRMAGDRPFVALFGIASDKDLSGCLAGLLPEVDDAVFVSFGGPRSRDPEGILAASGGRGRTAATVGAGLALSEILAGEGGVVLVTGSIYLAGAVKSLLEGEEGGLGLPPGGEAEEEG